MEEDPIQFNEKKRKLLGDEIHDSFLHPNKFKTNTFYLQSETNEIPNAAIKLKLESSASEAKKRKFVEKDDQTNQKKHKFQII